MAADRFVLAHIRELIRFGVTRREFAVTLRDEGVPFDEVGLARLRHPRAWGSARGEPPAAL